LQISSTKSLLTTLKVFAIIVFTETHFDALSNTTRYGVLMINHTTEALLSLSAAAKRLPKGPDGKPIHPNTVGRWIHKGIQGVHLEGLRVGRKRYTSIEAIQRFLEAITRAVDKHLPRVSRSQRQRLGEEAGQKLKEYGI
jgi:hypothetical protein